MDEAKLKRKKIIIGAISMLCVIVVGVGIAIGIGIIAGQKNNQPETETDDDTSEEVIDESEMSGKERLYFNYNDERDRVEAEVEKLFSESSVNVKKIKELYLDGINECMSYEAYLLADGYLNDGVDKFMEHGMEKEALEFFTSVNIEQIPEVDRCIDYLTILALAERLGESEIAAKYRNIVNNVTDGLGGICGSSSDITTENIRYRSE
jgi:hypothetical protein